MTIILGAFRSYADLFASNASAANGKDQFLRVEFDEEKKQWVGVFSSPRGQEYIHTEEDMKRFAEEECPLAKHALEEIRIKKESSNSWSLLQRLGSNLQG